MTPATRAVLTHPRQHGVADFEIVDTDAEADPFPFLEDGPEVLVKPAVNEVTVRTMISAFKIPVVLAVVSILLGVQ